VLGCALQRGVHPFGRLRVDAGMAGGSGHGTQLIGRRFERLAACPRSGFVASGLKDFSMDILFLLIPLSVALVLLILAGLWWAIHTGQFESIEQEGERILRND
jgi:cbb3-type cytochrome oxidase maturation protein